MVTKISEKQDAANFMTAVTGVLKIVEVFFAVMSSRTYHITIWRNIEVGKVI